MRLSREARRRLERKKERELKRLSKERKTGLRVGATMSLAVMLTLISNSISNAATIDDLRELLGENREDSKFSETQQRQIIDEYNNIESHNALANILNSFDVESFNKEIENKRKELEGSINTQKQGLVESFQSGASVEEVMSMKSLLENLKYKQSKIMEERHPITLKELKNNIVDEYQEVIENIEEVESYSDIGIVGSLLLSPLIDSLEITSPYGYRVHPVHQGYAMHYGVDFEAEIGKPVHTTWQGEVTRTYITKAGGRTVEVTHDDGLQTRYLHLDEILVSQGQKVNQYDQIGTAGETGEVTGPHLHFEVLVEGEHVNPMYFFGNKGAKALNNYIIKSEDPIVKEMTSIVKEIKSEPEAIAKAMSENAKKTIPGEYREVKYEREGNVPEGSIEVKLPEGYTPPTPTDEIN